jgi:hypothetical protein
MFLSNILKSKARKESEVRFCKKGSMEPDL